MLRLAHDRASTRRHERLTKGDDFELLVEKMHESLKARGRSSQDEKLKIFFSYGDNIRQTGREIEEISARKLRNLVGNHLYDVGVREPLVDMLVVRDVEM